MRAETAALVRYLAENGSAASLVSAAHNPRGLDWALFGGLVEFFAAEKHEERTRYGVRLTKRGWAAAERIARGAQDVTFAPEVRQTSLFDEGGERS